MAAGGSGPVAGSGSSVPGAGTGGTGMGGTGMGGTGAGGAPVGGSAGSGGSGGAAIDPNDPYAPRSGTFKVMVYSSTKGFRHEGAINQGKVMLQAIADETGYFTLEFAEDNAWLARIDDFELLFFLNPTGDIFNDQEQQVFQDWMGKRGAFAGTHSATDTENGWAFYSEVTGQYYNGHGPQNAPDQINLEPAMLNHPALKGIPNPWQRNEEWYKFDQHQSWTAKPGFSMLGRKQADGQPIMWIREWGNFRAFYTALGHDQAVFQDPLIRQHLIGGIMWAARREHLLP